MLSDRDFEDISSKVENRLSKRLRDTEVNQREILKLIENLSSKVDNLTNVNPGQSSLTFETGVSEIPNDELEGVEPARSVSSNTIKIYIKILNRKKLLISVVIKVSFLLYKRKSSYMGKTRCLKK